LVFGLTPPLMAPHLAETTLPISTVCFAKPKQEGTGLRPVLPLALRGKAFGFSALSKSTVITSVIRNYTSMLIINYLTVHFVIK